jgi:hypothetical protein
MQSDESKWLFFNIQVELRIYLVKTTLIFCARIACIKNKKIPPGGIKKTTACAMKNLPVATGK